jgi:hypothetical protein
MNRFSTYWEDSLNLMLGAALFVSPWVLGFVPERTAASNAHVVGAIITAIALAALFSFQV